MKNKYIYIVFLFLFIGSINAQSKMIADTTHFKLVNYVTEDGGSIEASFFKASKKRVVIFAHGAVFNKESWYFMAKKLQKKGISSLSIDFRGYGNSKKGSTNKRSLDILGAIHFLKEKGFNEISIVGGSMGGAAVLNALNTNTDKTITKVVLLAPAGGEGITSTSIKKLFVVSKNERLFTRVNKIYNESSNPKKLKIFSGTSHAQNMFKSEHREALMSLIINFLDTPE
ncbi:alpha/beta fold hydrolase [Lutibacter sp.]|uniref:alpha/beta hydrolase family protein n=1 Tax=Lutibacter sp. TaxID=1925666 RepID=UPI0025BB96A4|nr:alpha/beta fold hydrolase [Lutibacter sp.]MCF6169065.1 alpha/beta hydrolase [Lutibacter sp.]